jgi:bifunctional ADP-heptose synthase (sugar kinase/adenylyltransferase)
VTLSTQAFDRQLAVFEDQTVLCVGDLMLDEFN